MNKTTTWDDDLFLRADQGDVLGFAEVLRKMERDATDEEIRAVESRMLVMSASGIARVLEGVRDVTIGTPGIRSVPILTVLRDAGMSMVDSYHHVRRGYDLREAMIAAARQVSTEEIKVGRTSGLDLIGPASQMLRAHQAVVSKTGLVGEIAEDGAALVYSQAAILDAANVFRPFFVVRGVLGCRAFRGTAEQGELVELAACSYGHLLKDAGAGGYSFGEFADRVAAAYDIAEPKTQVLVSALRELDAEHAQDGWALSDAYADASRAAMLATAGKGKMTGMSM